MLKSQVWLSGLAIATLEGYTWIVPFLVPYKDVSFYWCFTTNHFCKLESQVFPLIFFFLSKILLFDGSNVAWMVDSVPIKRLIDLILRQKLWKRRDDLVRLKMSAKKKSAMSIWSHFRSASSVLSFPFFFFLFPKSNNGKIAKKFLRFLCLSFPWLDGLNC